MQKEGEKNKSDELYFYSHNQRTGATINKALNISEVCERERGKNLKMNSIETVIFWSIVNAIPG